MKIHNTNYFDMKELGKTIAIHRRKNNLTQGELAEHLGVSHQAVSSWENGLTCPDIAKLSELSRHLNLSIDELLGNETMAEAIHKIEDGKPLEEEEIIYVASLAKPDLLDELLDKMDTPSFSAKNMVALAPFLSTERLEKWVETYEDTLSIKKLVALAPFLSKKAVDRMVDHLSVDENTSLKSLVALAPFMSKEKLDTLLLTNFKKGSLKEIVALAPFISKDALGDFVKESLNDGSATIRDITALAPFLSKEFLQEIAEKHLREGSEKDILTIFSFLK